MRLQAAAWRNCSVAAQRFAHLHRSVDVHRRPSYNAAPEEEVRRKLQRLVSNADHRCGWGWGM